MLSEAVGFLSISPDEGGKAGQDAWRQVALAQAALSRSLSWPRSPPRPSPGGLHYSDDDICSKYNGAVLTESVSLQDKSADATESEVSACAARSRREPLLSQGRMPGLI